MLLSVLTRGMASDLLCYLAQPSGKKTANHTVDMCRGNQEWGEVFRSLIGERYTPQR